MTTKKVTVMLSSTITDMQAERDAIVSLFRNYEWIEVIGAHPIQHSYSMNPHNNTLNMAEKCDFYILLLGDRYGLETRSGVSATEAEFDRAVKTNPEKVLVFKNSEVNPEPKQAEFIKKVGDYYKGYWIAEYQYSHNLSDLVKDSFFSLLKKNISIGNNLTIALHFVIIANQKKPYQECLLYHSVTTNYVELTYEYKNKTRVIQFSISRVISDFWGCVSELDARITSWS